MASPGQSTATGRRVLVTGGAGYIGAVLVPRLVGRGYRVRVLDRLHWGHEPLAPVADRIEMLQADIRDTAAIAGALDGVEAVIALAGMSNDPTAELDPEASWQMNAVATEALGRECQRRGIERVVYASSCSLYDRLPGVMHDEDSDVVPHGAYATSKYYGERALLALSGEGLCPVVLRNATVYGWSPRMRYDLVVNTFVRDALLDGRLRLHGGGRMRRPLVDVRDAADALILVLEAPEELARGEIFNVVHCNQVVRELALAVAEAVRRYGRPVELEEVPASGPMRDYACSSAKLESQLGFTASRSVAEGIDDLLARIDPADHASLGDPRHDNLRWLAQAEA